MSGHASHPSSHCQNCGKALAGPFCSKCGQHDVDYTRSFWHILHEAIEDVFHFDGKLVRSFKYILTRPGYLTKEFNEGHRVRYAHPLRFYVFASFLFFAIGALTSGTMFFGKNHASSVAAGTAGKPAVQGKGWLDGLIVVDNKAGQMVDQEDVSREFDHLLPEMLFFCVPFLALVLRLVYRKSGKYFVEHLIFALHIQAFGFLFLIVMLSVMSLASLVGPWAKGAANAFFILLLFWMLYQAFRTVYAQSRWKTIGHVALTGFLYWIVVVVGMILVAFVSLKLTSLGS